MEQRAPGGNISAFPGCGDVVGDHCRPAGDPAAICRRRRPDVRRSAWMFRRIAAVSLGLIGLGLIGLGLIGIRDVPDRSVDGSERLLAIRRFDGHGCLLPTHHDHPQPDDRADAEIDAE